MRTDDLVTCPQVRAIRIENGYSIDQLADICSVSRNTIRKLEVGSGVRPTTLFQVLKRFASVIPHKRSEFDRIIFEVAHRAPPEQKKPSLYETAKRFERDVSDLILQGSRDELLEFQRVLGEIDIIAVLRIRRLDDGAAD